VPEIRAERWAVTSAVYDGMLRGVWREYVDVYVLFRPALYTKCYDCAYFGHNHVEWRWWVVCVFVY